MEIEFKHHDYDRLETDASFDAGLPAEVVRAYRKRLVFIRAAMDQRDFYALKSLHFEKLKGDRQTQHSIRLNKQWRLIIEFAERKNGKTTVIVSVEDYHK
jgi:proteic killer suppression protein